MTLSTLPKPVYRNIAARNIKALSPTWIKLAEDGCTIESSGGDCQDCFSTPPRPGDSATELCDALHGLLPFHDSFDLPQIQLKENLHVDIYAVYEKKTAWLIFSDVTDATLQTLRYQQTANDLILLREKQGRVLDRYLGQEVAERVSSGLLQFDTAGERKTIATLFVDIREFTAFNESHDAQVVMHTLNIYMECMLQPILNSSGIIDKITGDGAMAVFGVLPSPTHCSQLAFQAALEIMKRVNELNHQLSLNDLERLEIGIGIGTGDAVLGIIGAHNRRAFTVLGKHVNLASRLEAKAGPGEILMDEMTCKTLNFTDTFSSTDYELKGIGKVKVYSHKP
ncbi:MAG: adenylate/guanylate cyclase domain-containing protein [Mariprofundaceae bacterium]